jgi:hypothetical protein
MLYLLAHKIKPWPTQHRNHELYTFLLHRYTFGLIHYHFLHYWYQLHLYLLA